MNKLNTQDEIEKAVRDGKAVHWRNWKSEVKQTKAGNLVVNTVQDAEHWTSHKLATVIKTFGVNDFYLVEADQ